MAETGPREGMIQSKQQITELQNTRESWYEAIRTEAMSILLKRKLKSAHPDGGRGNKHTAQSHREAFRPVHLRSPDRLSTSISIYHSYFKVPLVLD